MAVRFDGSPERFYRTTDLLDYNSAYTIMGWVYFVGALSADRMVFSINYGDWWSSDVAYVDEGPWALFVANQGTNQNSTGASPSTSTWYHVALVRNSSTLCTLYVDGASVATNTQSISGRNAVAEMEVGTLDGGNNLDGRIAHIKAWSAALSLSEVQAERRTIRPRRLANLYAYWPVLAGATERLRDYSGRGRGWTAEGTLTDEADPGIGWGAAPLWVPAPAGAAPAGTLLRHPGMTGGMKELAGGMRG